MNGRVLTLLAILVSVLLSGCGSGGDKVASTAVDDAIGNGNIAESRAIEQEAKVEALREQVSRLKRERGDDPEALTPEEEQASRGGSNEPARSGTPTGGGSILPAAAQQSFEQFASSLPGEVGLAVSGVGLGQPVEHLGSISNGVAWSTSKVPVAMAAIAAGVADDGDLNAAITASDNAAATNLWNALGGGSRAATAADAQLRAAGDTGTSIQPETLRSGFTPFGQTDWPLAAQTQFTAGMACSAPGRQVLGLMGETVPAQRWGLGSTSSPAQLKGGWGPGSAPGADGGYFDRQMGVVTIDGTPVAAAIAALPADGGHESGTSMLTQLAGWLVENADISGLPDSASC
jgi:hypothetical protein